MFKKKYDLAIINRSFWPESEILGEAKLRLAEKVAKQGKVCVIAQSSTDVVAEATKQGRGNGVGFFISRSRSSSSSGLVRRIFDTLCFGPFVFWSLLRSRPKHVYVSTNPPVFIPFIVFLYCTLCRAKYTYHLQDIHPEITNLVVPMNKFVFKFLRWFDNITLRNAASLVTLTEEMANYLREASSSKAPIYLVDNPSFDISPEVQSLSKVKDLIFCGNAGRVQRIPILLEAIDNYISDGGTLHFTFAGSGVYTSDIQTLADKHKQVTYLGYVKPSIANKMVAEHRWALLPIDDEVTKYAFPSKSSSYLAAGCNILGICSRETSLANWIKELNVGISVEPNVSYIVNAFRKLETESEYNGKKLHIWQTVDSFVQDISTILKKNSSL